VLSATKSRNVDKISSNEPLQSEAELISDINCKLLRSVGKFNPERGSAFSFV
jgi:hypothetical protein